MNLRDVVITLGKAFLPRQSRRLQTALAALLVVLAPGVTKAQQPTGSSPTVVPAGKTPEQASISASGASGTTPSNAAQNATGANTSDASEGSSLVKLGPGDLIEVNVYNVPELTTKARVSNSGDVYLPLIDYVHVDGLTQEEAQTVIEKRLESGGFVRNPHVTIFVDDAQSQGVTVLGEVSRPGIYPDLVDHRLYQVISEAGGFTQTASRKLDILRRGQPTPIKVDLPRNLGDNFSGDVEVLPGDTVTVPRAPIVYVVGDVQRPSGILIDNGTLTVLQALALAGGTNHTAKMGGVRIIRKTPTGMTTTRIPLKKMLEAKAADIPLEPDDILFVPLSGLKVAAARTAEAAVSAATAISVYTVAP
jgi:polysaccharide biosynthesis/export protein